MTRVLWLALSCHLLLAVGYLWRTPAFEAPDENDHYVYAFNLAQTGALPIARGTAKKFNRHPLDQAGLAHHPPLYYGLLATHMWVTGQADTLFSFPVNPGFQQGGEGSNLRYLHGYDEVLASSPGLRLLWSLRLWSVVFGLLTILLTHRMARVLCPARIEVADLAAMLVACLPMFSFLHGVLNNDNLATLWSHGTLLLLVTALLQGRIGSGRAVVLGIVMGLSLLTKITTLYLVLLWGLVVVWGLWRWQGKRQALLSAAITLGLLVLMTGWVYWRNWDMYGDPLAMSVHDAVFAQARVQEGKVGEWLWEGFLPNIFSSLLGYFGYWAVPPATWMKVMGWAMLLLVGIGWLRHWRAGNWRAGSWRAGSSASARQSSIALCFLLLAVALVFLLTLRFNLHFRQPQGRLLFPVLGPMAILYSLGLLAAWPQRWRALLLALLPATALTVFCLQFWPALDPAQALGITKYHARLVEDGATPPAQASMQLLAPTDGAELVQPPLLRWSGAAPEALHTIHFYTATGRLLLASHEWAPYLGVPGTEFQLPDSAWLLLPLGEDVYWKVRQLPDRALGQQVREMSASPAFRLRRLSEK